MYQLPQRQTAWRTISDTITTIGQHRYRAICLEVIGPGRSLFDPDVKPGDVERVAAMMGIAAAAMARIAQPDDLAQTAANRHEPYDLSPLKSREIAIFEVA